MKKKNLAASIQPEVSALLPIIAEIVEDDNIHRTIGADGVEVISLAIVEEIQSQQELSARRLLELATQQYFLIKHSHADKTQF